MSNLPKIIAQVVKNVKDSHYDKHQPARKVVGRALDTKVTIIPSLVG